MYILILKPFIENLSDFKLTFSLHLIGTLDAIKSAFNDADFPDFLDHLVGFCAYGASVNFGKKGGVQKLLSDMVPWLIPIWCLPHR